MRTVCVFLLAALSYAGTAQGFEYRDLRPDPPTIRVSDLAGRPFNPADLQPGWSIRSYPYAIRATLCVAGEREVMVPAGTQLVVHPLRLVGVETRYAATHIAATSTPIQAEFSVLGAEPTGYPIPDTTPRSSRDEVTVERSSFDLSLRSNLLAMHQQDGKTHTASATIWLSSGFGLTGGYFTAQECDSALQPLGLRNGERRVLGGLAFRAGDQSARLDRLALQLGTTNISGARVLTIGLEAAANLGPTSYELLMYGTRRPGNDAWVRGRGGLTVYQRPGFDLAFGGQYVNRSFQETVGTETIPIGFRYFNSAGGAFVALGSGYQNARFEFTGGAGKGSAPEFDYVEFEGRINWRF